MLSLVVKKKKAVKTVFAVVFVDKGGAYCSYSNLLEVWQKQSPHRSLQWRHFFNAGYVDIPASQVQHK